MINKEKNILRGNKYNLTRESTRSVVAGINHHRRRVYILLCCWVSFLKIKCEKTKIFFFEIEIEIKIKIEIEIEIKIEIEIEIVIENANLSSQTKNLAA
jgi:hypothetical protein